MDYKIYKQDSYWVIESERAIFIEDCCYDVTTDTFVIAVKHNKGGDYVGINREFEIVQTIAEEQGLNRKFVLAPDKSVWIGMSALCTEKNGEVILPLYGRERVEKEIVKSDLGVDYSFFWNSCHWGYVNDFWGDKPDKLLQYQFDKKGLYKTRKTYKMDELYHAVPFVLEDSIYLCQKDFENGIIKIYKMTEPGKPEEVCLISSKLELSLCRLINVDEAGYKIIGVDGDELHMLSADVQGKVLEEKLLYRLNNTKFYSIIDYKVSKVGAPVTAALVYAGENQSGVIEIKDSDAKEVLWRKNNVLHINDAEIETENKFTFHIMTDGSENYYIATNIQGGKSKKTYIVKEEM